MISEGHGFEMAAPYAHDCMVTVINLVYLAFPGEPSGGILYAFVSEMFRALILPGERKDI